MTFIPPEYVELAWKVATALAFFLIAFAIIRVATNRFRGVLKRAKWLEKRQAGQIASVISWALYGITAIIAVGITGIYEVLIPALAGVGIISLAIAFAAKDAIANVISGIILILSNPFGLGDKVRIGKYYGRIEKISLRQTVIRQFDGSIVFIPNNALAKTEVINYSKLGKHKIKLKFGISYESFGKFGFERIEKKVKEVISRHPNVKKAKGFPRIEIRDFGPSTLDLIAKFWINTDRRFALIKSEMRDRIYRSLLEMGVDMPYPRTEVIIANQKRRRKRSKKA